jgi:MscS family membrane protein
MSDFIKNYMWAVTLIITLLTTCGLHFISARVIDGLTVRMPKAIAVTALLQAVRLPIKFLIWLIGLTLACSIILTYHEFLFLESISDVRKIGVILLISWTLIRFMRHLETLYIERSIELKKELDKTLVHASGQLVTIVIAVISLLLIMQIMNIPIAGLLAFGGIGGAAVALASKELFANFFGGLVIYMDRPFKVGDWIRSPDKNIEGIVEFIGWRMTRLRTFDKRPLYIPNSVFLTISVENPSRMLHRRINTTIGIRYQDADKIEILTQQIKQMLLSQKEIDSSQVVSVNLFEFTDSALNIKISAYSKITKAEPFNIAQHKILIKILDIISAHGAECAFPTQTLYLERAAKS